MGLDFLFYDCNMFFSQDFERKHIMKYFLFLKNDEICVNYREIPNRNTFICQFLQKRKILTNLEGP